MSTERETESCKVFVGFVLPSTGISNPGMTYRDRAMGHCLWMDGWTGWITERMDGKRFTKNNHDVLYYSGIGPVTNWARSIVYTQLLLGYGHCCCYHF
jgi:hypothetical protein